jgi:hypothetical protein
LWVSAVTGSADAKRKEPGMLHRLLEPIHVSSSANAPQALVGRFARGAIGGAAENGRESGKMGSYVARERLCLSATADYWVNAMDGKPFFVVSQAVDPGLLQVLERDIVPRLEADVPNQPGAEQLDANPKGCR